MGEKKQIRETKEKQISNGEEEAKTSKETYTMARRWQGLKMKKQEIKEEENKASKDKEIQKRNWRIMD